MEQKNNIKETLTNFKVEVDNDALWASLADHVPAPKEKKRRFLPFWIFGGATIFILAAFFFFNQNGNTQPAEENLLTDPQPIVQQSEALSNTASPAETLNSKEEKSTQEQTNQFNTPIQIKTPITNNIVSNSQQTKSAKEIQINRENQNTQSTISNIAIINTEHIQQPTQNEAYLSEEKITSISEKSTLQAAPFVPILPASTLVYEQEDYTLAQMIEPINKPKVSKWAIQLTSGLGFVSKAQTTPSLEKAYLNTLQASQQDLPSIMLRAQAHYNLTDRLSLYGGLGYLRTTDRLKINIDDQNQEQLNGTKITIDPEGNITETPTTTGKTTILEYKARYHTYHHLISVPLGLEFDILKYKGLALSTNIGASLNLMTIDHGAILGEDNFLSVFENTDTPYKYTTVRPHLGLGINYNLNQSNSIGLGWEISRQLSSINTQNNTINQSDIINSINLNYRINF